MNRLTKRHSDSSVGISQFRYYNYDDFQKLARKLAEYEDLEEMLGIPFEQMVELCKEHVPDGAKYPKRAKVLTDESVDEWEQYKQDKEQGLLLRLPCKLGDTLHWFDGFGNYQHSTINCIYIENGLDDIKIETMCCTIDASELNKTIFLTKEELMKNEY